MDSLIGSAQRALVVGLALSLLILVLWVAIGGIDRIGLVSFLLRWIHVLGAIVWVGLIFFVNFIQFSALEKADDAGRRTILSSIAAPVGKSFQHASHLTILSGILLLVTSGYLLDRIVFTSTVYIPPLRNLLLWGGVVGGLLMWAFVQFVITPNLRIVLGATSADAVGIARAREQVRTFARINLLLAMPVTFVMVAATHLY
jgi:uncharacterized membrane protein